MKNNIIIFLKGIVGILLVISSVTFFGSLFYVIWNPTVPVLQVLITALLTMIITGSIINYNK
jgi:hypothetical protein